MRKGIWGWGGWPARLRSGAAGVLAAALGAAAIWPGAAAAALSPLTLTTQLSSTAFGTSGVTLGITAQETDGGNTATTGGTLVVYVSTGEFPNATPAAITASDIRVSGVSGVGTPSFSTTNAVVPPALAITIPFSGTLNTDQPVTVTVSGLATASESAYVSGVNTYLDDSAAFFGVGILEYASSGAEMAQGQATPLLPLPDTVAATLSSDQAGATNVTDTLQIQETDGLDASFNPPGTLTGTLAVAIPASLQTGTLSPSDVSVTGLPSPGPIQITPGSGSTPTTVAIPFSASGGWDTATPITVSIAGLTNATTTSSVSGAITATVTLADPANPFSPAAAAAGTSPTLTIASAGAGITATVPPSLITALAGPATTPVVLQPTPDLTGTATAAPTLTWLTPLLFQENGTGATVTATVSGSLRNAATGQLLPWGDGNYGAPGNPLVLELEGCGTSTAYYGTNPNAVTNWPHQSAVSLLATAAQAGLCGKPVPPSSGSPVTVAQFTGPSAPVDVAGVALVASIPYAIPAGTYTGTVTYTVTPTW